VSEEFRLEKDKHKIETEALQASTQQVSLHNLLVKLVDGS